MKGIISVYSDNLRLKVVWKILYQGQNASVKSEQIVCRLLTSYSHVAELVFSDILL